jgi:hypothetical protein
VATKPSKVRFPANVEAAARVSQPALELEKETTNGLSIKRAGTFESRFNKKKAGWKMPTRCHQHDRCSIGTHALKFPKRNSDIGDGNNRQSYTHHGHKLRFSGAGMGNL